MDYSELDSRYKGYKPQARKSSNNVVVRQRDDLGSKMSTFDQRERKSLGADFRKDRSDKLSSMN